MTSWILERKMPQISEYLCFLARTPEFCAKPDDSCHGMISQCSTKLPVMPHTDCLALLALRCPQKCWVRWRSGDCGGRSLTVRTSWAFSSVKVVLSKLWGVWAHCPVAMWIPPQIHKDQTRRWRMSLENGVVLLSLARVEACYAEVHLHKRKYTPRLEFYHCHVSLWFWNSVVSFSLLFTQVYWVKFCICDEVAYISLGELSFVVVWCVDLLMVGTLWLCLIILWIQLIPVSVKHFRLTCTAPLNILRSAMTLRNCFTQQLYLIYVYFLSASSYFLLFSR